MYTRTAPPGDTQQIVFTVCCWTASCAKDNSRWTQGDPKMARDGLRWLGGGLRWPQAGLKLAQHGSSDGLGGGFQSMTSYKNEQLTINTCEHNVDIGFKPL